MSDRANFIDPLGLLRLFPEPSVTGTATVITTTLGVGYSFVGVPVSTILGGGSVAVTALALSRVTAAFVVGTTVGNIAVGLFPELGTFAGDFVCDALGCDVPEEPDLILPPINPQGFIGTFRGSGL